MFRYMFVAIFLLSRSAAAATMVLQQQQTHHACGHEMSVSAPRLLSCRLHAQRQHTACSQHRQHGTQKQDESCCRRQFLQGAAAALVLPWLADGASAAPVPQEGFRVHQDKLDGYSFIYPDNWIPVTTSGNDIFFRNPRNVNENVFVNISSPSSSRYTAVSDIGSPDKVADRLKRQYLSEMMSTRLGVKRAAAVKSAAKRQGSDGKEYYDIQMEVQSFASRNQLAVTQTEIDKAFELEWDRRLITVLGAANNRLYEFRLQTANSAYEANSEGLLRIAESFKCRTVDV